MINTNSQLYKDWIAKLRTNPPKQKRQLANSNNTANCCLGVACNVAGITPIFENNEAPIFEGSSSALPNRLAKELNTTPLLTFTDKGSNIARIWLRENNVFFSSVTVFSTIIQINDYTDENLQFIGELIEYLAGVEQSLGIEIFVKYQAFLSTHK